MNLEPFAQGASPLHLLDPRIKIVAAFAFAVVAAVAQEFRPLIAALAAALLLVCWARLDAGALARRLLVINTFVALLWLFLPFTFPGQKLFTLGPLTASSEGVRHALLITCRTNAIVVTTIALLGTSSIFSLVHALRHLHMPEKLIHTFFFCYRYIDVIQLEYLRLRNAMRIRGFRPGTSMHTYRTYAYLVGMLLVRSYERSQRVYQAMLCRGFRGQYPTYHHFHLRRSDLVHVAVMALMIAALAVL